MVDNASPSELLRIEDSVLNNLLREKDEQFRNDFGTAAEAPNKFDIKFFQDP